MNWYYSGRQSYAVRHAGQIEDAEFEMVEDGEAER